MTDGWIVVPNWEKFQHYKDRDPAWIKLYTRLAHDDNWLSLTHVERSVLVQIWIEYALGQGVLSASRVRFMVHRNVRERALDSLQTKGWIEIHASPRARARARVETEKEKEPPPTPSADAEGINSNHTPLTRLSAKELRRYTGCKRVRGSHGVGFKRTPLGTDKPPTDWGYPPPTKQEVLAALDEEDF